MSITDMLGLNKHPAAQSGQRRKSTRSWEEMSPVRRYWASLIGSRPRPPDYRQIPSKGKHSATIHSANQIRSGGQRGNNTFKNRGRHS